MKVLILGATGMLGNAMFRFCLKILNLAFMVQLEAVVALDIFLKISDTPNHSSRRRKSRFLN